MKSKAANGPSIEETLAAIREQLAVLTERVTALESTGERPAPAVVAQETAAAAANGPAPVPATGQVAVSEEISEETLLLLSAAIAAFLGKKPRIRQIRLVNSTTWSRQGRANIHASHAFAVHTRPGATS
jgi:methylmalonyl-CoA carboxyltransferase large subunit